MLLALLSIVLVLVTMPDCHLCGVWKGNQQHLWRHFRDHHPLEMGQVVHQLPADVRYGLTTLEGQRQRTRGKQRPKVLPSTACCVTVIDGAAWVACVCSTPMHSLQLTTNQSQQYHNPTFCPICKAYLRQRLHQKAQHHGILRVS